MRCCVRPRRYCSEVRSAPIYFRSVGCFDENTLAAFVAGELDEVSFSAFEAHFDSCARCFAFVAATAKAMSSTAAAFASGSGSSASDGAPGLDVLRRGTRVGRYEVTSLVGAGAMGRVYAASDAELGRTVALKLVRAGRGADADRRLFREARTMAKLTHPNVVTVYDVGMFGDHVFLVMELIDGETLRTWLTASPRTRSVLTTFLAAGRGLAAAHAAGVVHRDFKPENVLLGRDGRVVVTDFGLARNLADEGEEPPILAGTLAYMAPEQLRREQIDARADQFSFCVALHEGLTGERPYHGKHSGELLAAISGQAFVDARGAPKHVQRAIRRGLSASPEDRFASMDALLAALARDPTATRRRAAAGALAAVALVAAGSRIATHRTERPSCRDEVPGKLQAVWGAPQRAAVRTAFLAAGVADAADTSTRVGNAIDTYGARWTAMHVEACDATHERREQSSELLDRRVGCLAERLGDLRTLIDVLVHADADVVNNAVNAVDGLGALDQCDALALGADRAMSTAQREKVAALRADLSRAKLLRAAGRVTDSLALAKAAAQASDALDDPSLAALARLRLGQAESAAGDAVSASSNLRRAAELADIAKVDALRAEALTSRLFVEGTVLRNGAIIAELDGAAAAVIARMGEGSMSAGLEGARLHALGNALTAKASLSGDVATHEQGAATLEKAAALREAVHGVRSPEVATTRNSLCIARFMSRAYESALEQCQRAVDIWVDRLGPTHPHLSRAYTNLGAILDEMGRLDEAIAQYEHAAALAAHALGEEHPTHWIALSNLGAALSRRGDHDRAISLHLRVLDLQERAPALSGVSREGVLTNLGMAYQRKGDLGRAREGFERALALTSRATDVSTWQDLRIGLASVLWADGKPASRRRARALVTAGRDALPPDAPERGAYDRWFATFR
ncbi:MAG: serine/threonine-protein kinase [Kofleriaceae bacterium]|nr:serine/threonine-protein kinase [Kofleriaceae bacterium]